MASVDLEHLRRLYAFHHWATDKAMGALSPVSAAQLDQKWGGSFGTGRALLEHVVGVERLWCDRWSGHSAKALPTFPASHSARDFRAEWEKIEKDQQRFMKTLTARQLDSDLTYSNIKGETRSYPFADILVHCANHGTYHRGQITHLLRDLGLPATSTDFLDFVDNISKR